MISQIPYLLRLMHEQTHQPGELSLSMVLTQSKGVDRCRQQRASLTPLAQQLLLILQILLHNRVRHYLWTFHPLE